MTDSRGAAQRRGKLSKAAITTLVIGLLLSSGLALLLHRSERRAVEDEFASAAEVATERLVDEVSRGVAVAEAVRGMVLASNEVTAAEFSIFVDELRVSERFPAANGVSIIAVMPLDQVADFERDSAAQGQDAFEVRPAEAVGEERWVIRYIEPLEINAAAIGFDIRSNPVAFDAAERAVADGTPHMTAPITLVQESGDQAGLVVYMPYSESASGGPDGFTSIIFRGTDLLRGTFEDEELLRIGVVDTAGGGPDGVGTIGISTPTGIDGDTTTGQTRTLMREVFGREWQITVEAAAGFRISLVAEVGALIAGLLLTIVLAALMQSLRRREQFATAMADEATEGLVVSRAELATANTQLERINSNLQQSNSDLTRFAHVASHDLKEPLRMVGGFVGILVSSLRERLGEDGLNENEETALDYVNRGVGRMQQLITDLLELAAVRHVKRRERVDVTAAVEEVIVLLRADLDKTNGTVEVGALADVEADPRQIRPLVQNLLSNALKFRRQDRDPVIKVSSTVTDGSWRLEVADNGIGIAPENRADVFDAFTRLHSREQFEGTGVGLAICQAVTQSYGGDLSIEDGIDGGARLVAVIPQGMNQDPVPATPSSAGSSVPNR